MSKLFNKSFLFLLLGALAFGTAELKSQDYSMDDLSMPAETEGCCDQPQQCCCSPLNIRVAYTTKRGIGRDTGYTTVGGFYCPNEECLSPYLDARVHYKDRGRMAGNFGAGLSQNFNFYNGPSKVRGYVFYDFNTTHSGTFNQIFFGFETFSHCFDTRLNVYLPLESRGNYHHRGHIFTYEGGYKAQVRNAEYTWRGLELELSRNLCLIPGFDLYVTAGTYALHSHRKSIWGGKFRVETAIYKGLGVTVETTYDDHFHSRTYGQFSWTIPFGTGCCWEAPCCVPVRREELIFISNRCTWKKNF